MKVQFFNDETEDEDIGKLFFEKDEDDFDNEWGNFDNEFKGKIIETLKKFHGEERWEAALAEAIKKARAAKGEE